MKQSERVCSLLAAFAGVEPDWLEPYLELYHELRDAEDVFIPPVCDPEPEYDPINDRPLDICSVETQAPAEPPAAQEPTPNAPKGSFMGPNAASKREIFERLQRFRRISTCSLAEIAGAAPGRLSVTDLSMMLAAHKVPFAKWEAVRDAMDKLSGGGANE